MDGQGPHLSVDSPGLDESLWWGLPRVLQGLEQQLWLLPRRGQEPRLQLGQSKMHPEVAPCPLLGDHVLQGDY